MDDLDEALTALADPTRRGIIELVTASPRRTSDLAEQLGVSVPAVSRHLRVLRDRGLLERVDVEGDGRGREYRIVLGALDVLGSWLDRDHWSQRLAASAASVDHASLLTRVGGFLDGFAQGNATFFEDHLATDFTAVFPGSAKVWGRDDTIASVADHAPYVEWQVIDSSARTLAPGITIVIATVDVRTTASAAATRVVQSMVFDDTAFDDTRPSWTLRALHQSPATS